MEIDEAIKYLERKGEVRVYSNPELSEEEKKFYTVEEKEKIEEVLKQGKIFGDPVVEVDF